MRHAEEVTFGGSGLDRAAELRERPEELERAMADPDARAVLLWRGKPLVAEDALVRLPLGHPALEDAAPGRTLLGRENGAVVVAADLSGWEPEGGVPETLGGFSDTSEQAHPAVEGAAFADLRRVMTRLGPRDAELAATARALFGWHGSHGFCARCGAASEVALAGWQRVCPSCGARHFPRTDPVVIMLVTRGNSVLVGRAPGWPEGMYSCLAGFVEPGETIEAAVRREVREEVGVEVGRVGYLASQPWPFPASLMIGCHGEATSSDITLDPVEIEEALWLSREELADAFAGTHPKVWPARDGAIARFLLRNWLADRLD
ncbi:NUDIX hydrolase [Roseivivax halodurans JCM 10272]|uniref:NAD(+) diphosphatase n=1 Tax=Roseivivax halodurans JCM 10272 TaxID=1449350 RepID=X7EHY9_9RHOB|nr:NAD(+) diphosphatase [Roseivivax halodurans]ETX15475.1 NUDIX hydrolase [Roseivivax halodurans JCM 10272]